MSESNVDSVNQQPADSSVKNETPKDSVSYDTHRKLLDEKKKLQAKLEAIEADKKKAEEDELARKGEIQKLLDLAKKEAEDLKAKLSQKEIREMQAKKLSAVVRGLGSNVDDKWFGVLGQHIDEVVLNPETGEIEQMSVTAVVENLKKTWPEMLKKTPVGMPADAPNGSGAGTISRAEWLKLSSKDMKKWKPEQIV